jgi:hypothetical protein
MLETMRAPTKVSLYQLLGTNSKTAKIVLFLCEQGENEIFASGPLKAQNRWQQENEILTPNVPTKRTPDCPLAVGAAAVYRKGLASDKCYRIVGDFEDGESEVSRVMDTGWCQCVLTPRDWGVLDPV